jgi:hypothetical protein
MPRRIGEKSLCISLAIAIAFPEARMNREVSAIHKQLVLKVKSQKKAAS